jgi:hypothetical protein
LAGLNGAGGFDTARTLYFTTKEKLSMKTGPMSLMAATAFAVIFGHAPALAQSLTGKVS